MKALPLWQPWASLVAIGAKRITVELARELALDELAFGDYELLGLAPARGQAQGTLL